MKDIVAALAQYGFVASFIIAAAVWLRLPRQRKWELLAIGLVGAALCLLLIKIGGACTTTRAPSSLSTPCRGSPMPLTTASPLTTQP